MRTIYKYTLPIEDRPSIKMPWHSKILDVQNQNGAITIWAIVNPDNDTEERQFAIYGTGHPTAEFVHELLYEKHIGSVQINGFVWHIFEVAPINPTNNNG